MKASLPYKYITSVKNGKQYVVFDYKDSEGKRKRKWVNTDLPEKCTKKALKEAVDQIVAEFDEQFRTGTLEKPRKSKSTSTPVSAMREPNAVIANTPESKMTMGEFVNEWLTAMRPNLARTTYQTYKSANRRFVEYLDIYYPGITLGELRHNHVQEFLNHKLDEGCKGRVKLLRRLPNPKRSPQRKKRQAKRLRQKQQTRLHLRRQADVKRKTTPLR